ncbi:hypothetical protein CGC58_03340 [Capnocytophaga stomatis]|uniref:RiboL-PSP-HEPN domain-containing protein n=1 Tax=Capnocytophaga stomatis TaxID=1848904 RepID=A0A250FUS4_9FLAO|nr:HEPN domain-containing protein [Capnocytophaga stomatis]ATA88843.1 hypothetical protein CGC58_03340 [Capnocytophaga stomatis]
MGSNSVEQLWDEINNIRNILMDKDEVSLLVFYEKTMAKVFLFSCASFFEAEMKKILEEYVKNYISDKKIAELVKNKILSRDYHTLFNWNAANINNFTGLFGADFKKRVETEIENNANFKESTNAFLDIGKERNQSAHNDFASYNLPKTIEEVHTLYEKAKEFPIKMKELLTERNDETNEISSNS